eukprot:CAMPEP_0170223072 /NCGR_PEP_ID=MMETSP0116_2-20130129/11233_1 /TAXON_ID=400756 /ORGANISM="Durinskia baltica, Strain CSIRO CS-38" /LENGTH=656 /DNA_ID=CAMNT_0010473769 /DNA_START=92 /DNA_END=2062 /DNA_ORIENTATION=+
MRSKGLRCPSLSSFLRGLGGPTLTPAERDVAIAIYMGGRVDDEAGLQAVAYIIKNRCITPGYPTEPQTVVLTGIEQFPFMRQADRKLQPVSNTASERRLVAMSRRLAAELANPPHQLSGVDPTGGALFFDALGPATLHGVSRAALERRRAGSSGAAMPVAPLNSGSSGVASAGSGPSVASASSVVASASSSRGSVEHPYLDDISEPTRPALPRRSRRPFFFNRDRGGPADALPPASSSSSAVPAASSNPSPPPLPQVGTRSAGSAGCSPAAASSSDQPPQGRHGRGGGRSPQGGRASSGYTSPTLPAARFNETQFINWPGHAAGLTSSSSGFAPDPFGTAFAAAAASSRFRDDSPQGVLGGVGIAGMSPQANSAFAAAAAITASAGGAAPNPRWLARQAHGGHSGSPRSRHHHFHHHGAFGGHRGPPWWARAGDDEDYQDVVLPCGLFQDEVIEIMYRDLKPEDFEMLNKLDEQLPKKNIVKRNLIDKLPRKLASDCDSTECGVCLAELEPASRVVNLPCNHAFHPACISRWLTQCKNTCPLCFVVIDDFLEALLIEEASRASSLSVMEDRSPESARGVGRGLPQAFTSDSGDRGASSSAFEDRIPEPARGLGRALPQAFASDSSDRGASSSAIEERSPEPARDRGRTLPQVTQSL